MKQITEVKVLVVEDNESLARVVEVSLERTSNDPLPVHFDVRAVHTVAEARQHLSNGHGYDVVLSDMDLPDGNGLQVMEASRVPVVFFTGNPDWQRPEVQREMQKAHAVVPKPYLNRLRRALYEAAQHGGVKC